MTSLSHPVPMRDPEKFFVLGDVRAYLSILSSISFPDPGAPSPAPFLSFLPFHHSNSLDLPILPLTCTPRSEIGADFQRMLALAKFLRMHMHQDAEWDLCRCVCTQMLPPSYHPVLRAGARVCGVGGPCLYSNTQTAAKRHRCPKRSNMYLSGPG